MSKPSPEARAFVSELVFALLDAIRTSREYQEAYRELTPKVKAANTRLLKRYADKTTDLLLESHPDPTSPSWQPTEAEVAAAILRAIDSNAK